jgi:uncharacterized membrane protein YccF (DUF307 family)
MKYLIFGAILIALGYVLTQPLGSILGFTIPNPYAGYSQWLYYAGAFFVGFGFSKEEKS